MKDREKQHCNSSSEFSLLGSKSQMNPPLGPHKPPWRKGLSQDVLNCLGLTGGGGEVVLD